jgi:hydroxymethylglutaryl-CoA synthase
LVGIVSIGCYLPYYRLARGDINRAWGKGGGPGDKAVANFDEDSLTMAVAASFDCLKGLNPQTIDRLYCASTTFPYLEKQSGAIIARALDLRKDVFTVDVSNTLRSGTNAVQLAIDAVESGAAERVLVCASDVRLGLPSGSKELEVGDGAAALLIGKEDLIATFDHTASVNDEILDTWRLKNEYFLRSSEDRFGREAGYTKVVTEAIDAELKKWNIKIKDITTAVIYSQNIGAISPLVKVLGFDPKTQLQDSLYNSIGNLGSALAPFMLVAALSKAKAGNRILWAGYGDGCDVFVITAKNQDKINKYKDTVEKQLSNCSKLLSYQNYMRWRDIVATEPAARPPSEAPSPAALWRDSANGLGLIGNVCQQCGTPQFPPQRICISCKTKDNFKKYSFYGRKACVYTFSHDSLAASPNPPTTIAAVDFEGGGRIMCDVTDREPAEIKVGQLVEMVFRELRSSGGIHDYGWKCRPIRSDKKEDQ